MGDFATTTTERCFLALLKDSTTSTSVPHVQTLTQLEGVFRRMSPGTPRTEEATLRALASDLARFCIPSLFLEACVKAFVFNQKPGDAFGERLEEEASGDEAQPDMADAGGHQDNAWTCLDNGLGPNCVEIMPIFAWRHDA